MNPRVQEAHQPQLKFLLSCLSICLLGLISPVKGDRESVICPPALMEKSDSDEDLGTDIWRRAPATVPRIMRPQRVNLNEFFVQLQVAQTPESVRQWCDQITQYLENPTRYDLDEPGQGGITHVTLVRVVHSLGRKFEKLPKSRPIIEQTLARGSPLRRTWQAEMLCWMSHIGFFDTSQLARAFARLSPTGIHEEVCEHFLQHFSLTLRRASPHYPCCHLSDTLISLAQLDLLPPGMIPEEQFEPLVAHLASRNQWNPQHYANMRKAFQRMPLGAFEKLEKALSPQSPAKPEDQDKPEVPHLDKHNGTSLKIHPMEESGSLHLER